MYVFDRSYHLVQCSLPICLDLELNNKHAEWVKIVMEAGQAPTKTCGVLHNSSVANISTPYNTTPIPSSSNNKTGTPKLMQAEYDLLKER